MTIFISFMAVEDNIGLTIKNKENQKEVSLNDNEHDKQSEEGLEKFKEEIQEIIKNPYNFSFISQICIATENYLSKNEDLAKISDTISKIIKDNPNLACNIINGFTQGCILKEMDLMEIGDVITRIKENNPNLKYNDVINSFVQTCISEGRDLMKIGDVISKIVKNNPDSAFDIICGFTRGCISAGKNLTNISNTFSKIIKNNPDYAFGIICVFTQGCILQGKDLTEIGGAISEIVKNNSDSALNIVCGFTQSCISKGKGTEEIGGAISEIVKNNSDSALNIVCGFIQGCIFKGEDIKDIGNVITEIIQTDRIKDNPDLVFNIINGFVQGCLTTKPDNIKDITESFFNLFNSNFGEKEKEIKDKLKPIFSLIVSQYFMNTLTNSGNKQLSEEDKKQTETKLFECYQKLFHVEDKQGFQDIPLKELLDLQDKYLKKDLRKKVSIMVENTKLS